ncbi:MAG: hypothetical protein ACK4IX_00880 [Candidatus Sericytochromatia bacterium]
MSEQHTDNKFTAKNFIKRISDFFYSATEKEEKEIKKDDKKVEVNIYEQIRKEEIKNIIKNSDRELSNLIKDANIFEEKKIPHSALEIKGINHLKNSLPNLNKSEKNKLSDINYIKIKADTFINRVQDTSEIKTGKKTAYKKVSDQDLFEKLKENIIQVLNKKRSTGSIKSHRVLLQNMSEEDINLIEKFKEKALKLQLEQSKAKEILHPVNKFRIYTERLMMGIIIENTRKSIIVGGNTKSDFIDFMKEYTIANYDKNIVQSTLNYDDISIKAEFDDKSILKSIEFSDKFIGSTIKDLKIGDILDKALHLYGEPKKQTDNMFSWDKFEVYFEENKITKFKIGS